MSIFQPQLTQVGGSAVTPQTPSVQPSTAASITAAVAPLAVQAGFALSSSNELGKLNKEFNKIASARKQGASIAETSARARAALSTTMANAPWAADSARGMFDSVFGAASGATGAKGTGAVSTGPLGTGGILTPTLEEKAQGAHLQKVQEVKFTANVSEREAEKIIAIDARADNSANIALLNKNQREGNFQRFNSALQDKITSQRVKDMNGLNQLVAESNGALNAETLRNFNASLKLRTANLKQSWDASLRDENGVLTVSDLQHKSIMEDLDTYESELSAMASDSEYTKLLNGLEAERTAEFNANASAEWRLIKQAKQFGGEPFVEKVLAGLSGELTPDQEAVLLTNPFWKAIGVDGREFKNLSNSASRKVVFNFNPAGGALPEDQAQVTKELTQGEALSFGEVLFQKGTGLVKEYLTGWAEAIKEGTNDPATVESLIERNPQAGIMSYGSEFRKWKTGNKDKSLLIADMASEANLKAFTKSFVSSNGRMPEGISVVVDKRTTTGVIGSRMFGGRSVRESEVLNITHPANVEMTDNQKAYVQNIYETFKENPEKLAEVANLVGTPAEEMTPELATTIAVNQGRAGVAANLADVPAEGRRAAREQVTSDVEANLKAIQGARTDKIIEVVKKMTDDLQFEQFLSRLPPEVVAEFKAEKQGGEIDTKQPVIQAPAKGLEQPEATLNEPHEAFFNFISKNEAGSGGYDAVVSNAKKHAKGFKPSEHTIQEVMDAQRGWVNAQKSEGIPQSKRSSAVGFYQIVSGTLKEAVNKLGIDPEQPFSKDVQDQIAVDYLLKGKRPAVGKYLDADSPTKAQTNAAVRALQAEWEAFSKQGDARTLEVLEAMRDI